MDVSWIVAAVVMCIMAILVVAMYSTDMIGASAARPTRRRRRPCARFTVRGSDRKDVDAAVRSMINWSKSRLDRTFKRTFGPASATAVKTVRTCRGDNMETAIKTILAISYSTDSKDLNDLENPNPPIVLYDHVKDEFRTVNPMPEKNKIFTSNGRSYIYKGETCRFTGPFTPLLTTTDSAIDACRQKSDCIGIVPTRDRFDACLKV